MNKKKAQTSVDFMIILGVLLLIFVLLFQFVVRDRFSTSVEKQISLSARSEAEHVAFVIQTLSFAGEGSNKTFFVSSTLDKETSFVLTVYDEGFVVVDYLGKGYSVALFTKAVNQSVLSSGQHVAVHRNGVIYFDS